MNMPPLCVLPFTHLNIKHNGKVSSCWKIPFRMGDYNKDKIKDIINNESFRDLRRKMVTNKELPRECDSCIDYEKNKGYESTRYIANKRYNIDDSSLKECISSDYKIDFSAITSIEVRLDNTCDLMCRMCGPDHSTTWHNAIQKDKKLRILKTEGINYSKSNTIKFKEILYIIEIFTNIRDVYIAGGEPFLSNKLKIFLMRILKYNQNIENVIINTNGLHVHHDPKILNVLKHFKCVDIRISIDGYPDIYGYIRQNGNIHQLEKNIELLKTFDNFKIEGTCTTSLYNITRIPQIIKYFLKLKIPFNAGMVQYPADLNIKRLKRELRNKVILDYFIFIQNINKIIQKNIASKKNQYYFRDKILKSYKFIIHYLSSEDISREWFKFINYNNTIDYYNKTDYKEIYPEYCTDEGIK